MTGRPCTLSESVGASAPSWKVQCFADPRKDVALGDPTGIAFINGRAQSGQLRFVLVFLVPQCPQRCAHNGTGAFVASALDPRQYEAVKLVGQMDDACRDISSPFPNVANRRRIIKESKRGFTQGTSCDFC